MSGFWLHAIAVRRTRRSRTPLRGVREIGGLWSLVRSFGFPEVKYVQTFNRGLLFIPFLSSNFLQILTMVGRQRRGLDLR